MPTGQATQAIIAALGGQVVVEYTVIHGGAYIIPANALSQLDSNPLVKYVSVDRQIHHKLDYSAAAVNASAAWSAGWTGSGVGVAIIDSGINADPNLANIAYTQDFTGATGSKAGIDQFGHGQHVAGIVASTSASTATATANATFTRNFVGMAPGANLINLRVLDSTGTGSDSTVIAAIDTALQLQNIYNIRVINLSLGRPVSESYTLDPLCQAVEAAWKGRAALWLWLLPATMSRDNTQSTSGYGTIDAPGNDPYVIAGRCNRNGELLIRERMI